MTPKISVIVPVFNVEKWLRHCIDSILKQTFTDFELLLIDDGSKDSSGAICDEYAASDPRIRVFHKPNGGVSSARNLGLDNARGEWVTFVDSDDWIDKDYLSTLLIGKDSDLSVCSFKIEGSEEQWKDRNPDGFLGLDQIKLIFDYDTYNTSFAAPWCKLFSLRIIREYQVFFNTNISSWEDTLFFLNYLQHCNCIFCSNEKLYHYNRAVEGLSKLTSNFRNLFFVIIKSLDLVLPALSQKIDLRIEEILHVLLGDRINSIFIELSGNVAGARELVSNIQKSKCMDMLMHFYQYNQTISQGRKKLIFNYLYNSGYYIVSAYFLLILNKLGFKKL